ncbi:MAG: hypothetical protein AAFN44_17100 [Pseudomonadota bacterium]
MNDEDDPSGVRSVAVSGLVSSSLIAALIRKLAEKGVLSDMDTREIYDDALHSLEVGQADADAETQEMYRLAREVIEGPLRDT